jgi:hypothetical protein
MWDLKKLGDMRYRAVCKKGFMVFDLRERKVVDEFRHPSLDEVTAVCDMPDGGFVASVNPRSGPDKNKVVLLQRFSAARELVATYRCEGFFYARSLQWDRDGKTLLLSWEKGFARIRLPKEGNVCEVAGDFRQPKGRNLFDVVPSISGDGYVAGCGYRGGLVRFDKDGKVQSAWFVPEQDGCISFFYAQPHEMPDGHVYMAHWTGHGANDSTKGWQVVEFDGEGRAVWHLHDPERLGSVSGIDVLPTAARTAGWDNINPDRKDLPPQKILWTADLAQAKLELRDGAEGSMRTVDADGCKALEIVKANGKGTMVVKLPPFAVAKKARLRASVRCSSCDGDPEMGDGCVRLYGKKEDLTSFQMPDERRVGGPYLDKMVNSPPGGSIRKLAYRVADDKTGTNITAAIVVSGPPCTSRWSALVVEDNAAARKAWNAHKTALEPVDVTAGMISAETFAAQLAADTDHTAKIAKIGDYTRLLIDGKEAAPVIFKGQTSKGDVITYAGGIHDKKGVHLQMVTVRFGRTEKNPLGIWTKDGFDAKAGAELVRTAMRLAPGSRFLLGLRLDAYPEWVDMHPGEEWLLEDGRKVYGHHVHASFKILPEKPKDKWYWPSYHSVAWREEVKARIAELVEELRRQGLLKRIVGVHLAGYHDAQFATRQPDFSKCAVVAFVEWQKQHLGEVKWTTAPKFGPEEQLDPVTSAHQVAYLRFIKQGPFHVQEDIARHIRRLFGKDIVVGRYCMGWGAVAFNSALDLDPFLLSDSIDFLVAQPSYTHRLPGVAIGSRIPTRSFHDNGKLFVNEFDLRTYAGVHGGETEMMVLRCSQAQDFPMWQSIHHKVAGQMMSQRMGWWYLDMSGTWFSPPEIAQDIADVNALVPVAEREDTWHPSVAVATDEAGMLLRNSIAHYYGKGEGALQDQVRAFAASGVPHDSCMVDDFLRHPERAERYKAIVFVGMRHRDAGREALLKRLADKGVKCAFLTHENSITPTDFLRFVRDAGGYVPAEYGLEVDMNGSFISVHALRGGKFNFRLPRRCSVHNMKTGACEVKDAEILPLGLVAGETCWFRLSD